MVVFRNVFFKNSRFAGENWCYFKNASFLNGIFINFRLIWNLTVKSRWEALGGTDPGRLDAEAEATGGLGSEGRGRGVEQTRGTGGSPCLLSGSSAGSGGSSGSSGGGAGSGGRGYVLPSTEPVRFRTGGTYVCGE